MNKLAHALSLGLQFIPPPSFVLKNIVHQLRQSSEMDRIPYCTIQKASQDTLLTSGNPNEKAPSTGVIWLFDDSWIWGMMKGHGRVDQDDFQCRFATFDDLLDKAIEFYFGNPTNMNGWMVPLHRHPELDSERVRHVIMNAQLIAATTFDALRQQLEEESEQREFDTIWDKVYWRDFIAISHDIDPNRHCFLRRGMQEAYIVEGPSIG